jgi:rod shape determining protein RodA
MYFVERTKSVNFFKQFDYMLFISVLVLSVAGLIILSSAVRAMANSKDMMNLQIASLIIGVIISIIISALDYKSFKAIGFFAYFITLGLLVYVLFKGVGLEEVGSNSWIIIPIIGNFNLSFQPSELAKVTYIILISTLLERIKEGHDITKNIIKIIVYALLPLGLLIKQPDFGMAIVFIVAFFAMIYIYGIKYKHMLIASGAVLFTAPFLWFFALNQQRKKRIIEFIFPGADPKGASYQLNKAQIAIGSGQISGSGLYKGIQTQTPPHIGGVPVRESDMIFSVIGEELGFIGSILIIAILLLIILRCIYIAKNSRDHFGSFLVTGMVSMLAFQSLQNIGMNLRLTPVTGLPLPFISQGGSAMITNYISIGIILSVSIRRKRPMFTGQQ